MNVSLGGRFSTKGMKPERPRFKAKEEWKVLREKKHSFFAVHKKANLRAGPNPSLYLKPPIK